MAEKRKQYSPEFKFKVVLESLQRDTTMEAVCRKFGVSCSMVSRWRHAFQQRGPEVFAEQHGLNGKAKLQRYEPGESPDELKKLIGELIVQNEVLKKSRRLPGDNL